MASLKRIGVVAATMASAHAAHAEILAGSTQWDPLIAAASARYDVPVDWITRVMRAESGGRTLERGLPIRSRAGAIGLMQLMPKTWQEMRVRSGLGGNPDDPHDNVMAGTAYLRLMYDRFGYPGLFAAYNAGPARYNAYLHAQTTLPAETAGYVATLARSKPPRPLSSTSQRIFALRRDLAGDGQPQAAPGRLFAIISPQSPAQIATQRLANDQTD